MPSGVERAIADSLSLEHPDIPWTLPASLPTVGDLHAAIAVLTVPPATRKHVSWCLSKLQLAFEPQTKLSEDDKRLRAETWYEACSDFDDELWSKATLEAIQSKKWMPKPAEFRQLVAAKLTERATKLSRCRQMLEAQGGRFENGIRVTPGAKAKPFQREPEDVRLRGMRDSFRKIGNMGKAARYERELAKLEHREPEAWALAEYFDPAPTAIPTPEIVPLRTSPESAAALKRSLARSHRAIGNTAYADKLDAEADRLAPEEHRDVAEVA